MKRKLFLLLSLLMFVVPLSACGEDPDTLVKVTTAIAPPSNMLNSAEVTYDVFDCAKISEGGTYTRGSRVVVNVEVSTSCKVDDWLINGVSAGVQTSTLVLEHANTMLEELDIKAIIVSKRTSIGKLNLQYGGLYKESVSGFNPVVEKIDESLYGFPYTTKKDIAQINIAGNLQDGYSLSKALTSAAQDDVNLNYVFLRDTIQDEFKILPARINWYQGEYDNGLCTYEGKGLAISKIDEPINGNLCIRAFVDETDTIKTQIEQKALENFLISSAYVANNNTDSCLGSADGKAAVSENCFYVARLKNLYNLSGIAVEEDEGTMYYGYNNKKLEAVITTVQGTKKLYICLSETISVCRAEDSYKIDYDNTKDFENLGVLNFISKFVDATVNEYIYDYDINDFNIKSVVVDDITYHVNILPKDTYYGSSSVKFEAPRDSVLYTVNLDEDVDVEVFNTVSIWLENLPRHEKIATSLVEFQTNLKEYLYNKINDNSTPYELKNYAIDVEVDPDTNSATVNFTLALPVIDESYKFVIFDNGYDVVNICGKAETACSGKTNNELENFVTVLTQGNLSIYEIKEIVISSDNKSYTYTYKVVINGKVREITYNTENATFTLGDTVLKYEKENNAAETDISEVETIKIESISTTVLGVIKQTLVKTAGEQTITTSIGNTELVNNQIMINGTSVNVPTSDIQTVLTNIADAKIYQVTHNSISKYLIIKGSDSYEVEKQDESYILTYQGIEYFITLD